MQAQVFSKQATIDLLIGGAGFVDFVLDVGHHLLIKPAPVIDE